jgi:hypothetical protein
MSPRLAVITPTYARDLPLFARLHASAGEFLAPDCDHVVIVPGVDRRAFARFVDDRTRILAVEDVVPGRIFLLPRSLNILRSGRDVWLTLRTAPIRGWIMQQIVKLAAAAVVDRDVLLIMDSDLVFTRPVGVGDFVRDGKVRLYKQCGTTAHLPSHQRWYRSSAQLLGVEESRFFGDNYVSPAISWSRPVLIRLLRHLEVISGWAWWLTLARTLHLSEYILYGAYADAVLGAEANHYHDPDDHFLNSWDFNLLAPGGEGTFLAALRPDHLGVHVDSQLPLAIADRNRLLDRLRARAAEIRARAE